MRLIPRKPNRALARDVETERLWLRSIGPLRAVLLVAPWRHHPEMMGGLMLYAGKMSLWQWLRAYKRPNNVNRFSYAILPKAGTRAVGLISIQLLADGSAESHIGISDAQWRGHQVSIEARAALMTLFFGHGVTQFQCSIDSRNFASVFVYKRLGFRFIEAVDSERFDRATGRKIQRVRFILTREDWERQPARGVTIGGSADAR
jgi:RimJ/RimL family protein N-acetyltransferase